jgi:hypothetical protein
VGTTGGPERLINHDAERREEDFPELVVAVAPLRKTFKASVLIASGAQRPAVVG